MPCCSEITKDVKSSKNILDYMFKTIFIIVSSPLIAVSLPFKRAIYPIDVFYSSLAFFNKKFIRDIHNGIINFNPAKLNCRVAYRLHMISPRLAGFTYKNFGYIFIIVIIGILLGGVCLWLSIH